MKITSEYGIRKDPFFNAKAFHNGVDIKAKKEPVYSILPGKVTKVSYDKKMGLYIEVTHQKGYKSIYGHLSEFFVLEGNRISIEKPIGITGSTGRSTAPHLHFILKKHGKTINPIIALKNNTNGRKPRNTSK